MRTTPHAVVREVLRRIEREPGTLPWDDVPGAVAAFGTRGQLLRTLQTRWHAHLAAQLDAAVEADGPSMDTAVHAYRASVDARSALRATLDRHRADPALKAAEESELALLAVAAGFVEIEAPRAQAVAVGRRVRAQVAARSGTADTPQPANSGAAVGARCRATGWLRRRLRAVSAA